MPRIGSHAEFNPRHMEHGHGSNPKQKRKGSSSPTKEPISKKKPGKTTEKKSVTKSKAPTKIDNDSLLGATAKATKYACELVEGLADEFYHEDQIGVCMTKVAKALELVCQACSNSPESDKPKPSPRIKEKKTPRPTPSLCHRLNHHLPRAKHEENIRPTASRQRNNKKTRKNDSRTPTNSTSAPGTLTKVVALAKQPETEPIEQVEESFTLVQRLARKSNTPITQLARKARKRPAAVLVKINEGRTYADTLPTGTNIDFEAMGTHVTSIRKTLKGDLLVELTKGSKATAVTSVIRDQFSVNISGSIVTRLRHTAEVEITDLAEVTTKDEVLAATLKTLNDDDLPSAEEVKITGL
ncbi:hypothetical protein QTP88_027075 [Uroleucon formosanum]